MPVPPAGRPAEEDVGLWVAGLYQHAGEDATILARLRIVPADPESVLETWTPDGWVPGDPEAPAREAVPTIEVGPIEFPPLAIGFTEPPEPEEEPARPEPEPITPQSPGWEKLTWAEKRAYFLAQNGGNRRQADMAVLDEQIAQAEVDGTLLRVDASEPVEVMDNVRNLAGVTETMLALFRKQPTEWFGVAELKRALRERGTRVDDSSLYARLYKMNERGLLDRREAPSRYKPRVKRTEFRLAAHQRLRVA